MSGGIKYRLSPRERSLVADSLGVLDLVRARTKPMGVDVKLSDDEMEVSVEEKGGEISYEFSYPLDNDVVPGNGRIYVKDAFRLQRHDGKLLGFERAASQQAHINEKIRFWVELARRDHPQAKIRSHPEHLEKLLQDLSDLPKPKDSDQDLKTLLGKTLPGLHRPFPNGSQALVDANFAVFIPVRDSLLSLGFKLKFGDPQSGLTLHREGERIFLGLQLVLDNDSENGLESERNGRIYMNDRYEIDAASGKILAAKREFTLNKASGRDFDQALEVLKALEPLSPDLPELQKLSAAWLRGLGVIQENKSENLEPAYKPEDKLGQAFWRLQNLTGDNPSPSAQLLPLSLPSDPELRRNLHRALTLIVSDDFTTLESEAKTWPSHPALNCLLRLSRQDIAGATQALDALEPSEALHAPLRNLIQLQIRSNRLQEVFPILELALQEKIQKTIHDDQAWSRGFSRAWQGESPVNPEMRRVAVGGFLRRLRDGMEVHGQNLSKGIEAVEGDGPFEKEIRALLKSDANLRELILILDDPDSELRRESLIHLARGRLKEPQALPTTALNIAERYATIDPRAEDLRKWLSGQANFGQKFESALGHFSSEVANPLTLGTMMLAGSASKLGKFAFVRYFGNGSLGLKIGAEAMSVGLEATVFVGTDKIYQSAFRSPAGVWEHAGKDWTGALLAFGVLRGGGIAGRRLQGTLRESEGWQTWLQGRSRLAWAEKPLKQTVALSEASGAGALWKRPLGQTLSWPLRYISETGLPRAWLKPSADFAAQHGLIMASLITANSLSRFAGLRPGSPQGWKADLVDDALMYGHFYVAGQLLHRMGPSRLDSHLAALESNTVPGLRKTAKLAEASSPEVKTRSAPTFEIPPQLREFGRKFSGRFAEAWTTFRSRSLQKSGEPKIVRENARLETLKSWLSGWRQNLAGLRWPWRVEKPTNTPEGNTASAPNRLALPPAPMDRSVTLPPPPSEPAASESFLLPLPLQIPLRLNQGPTKTHMAVSLTGRQEHREVLPVSKNTLNYESVLGREEVAAKPEAIGVDLGFPSLTPGVEPQHARLRYQVKLKLTIIEDELGNKLTLGVPERTIATLENLAKSESTFVNGKTIRSVTLKNGDHIQLGEAGPTMIFHQESPDSTPTFTRAVVPLSASQNQWTFGRESLKHGSPDIAFPISSRDISTKQGRILRDAQGNFYVQDRGSNPITVNGEAVYGTRSLQDGDLIRFGEQNEFLFRGPKQPATAEAHPDLSAHPHREISAPLQADRHPMFRDMSEEQVQAYFVRLAASDSLPLELVRAGSLTTPQGKPLILMTQYTGWSVGDTVKGTTNSRLKFREASEAKDHPFQIYIDQRGDFILKPLRADAAVYVQGRKVHFWSQDSSVPDPQGPRQKVEGWTRLLGGERIHAGDRIYFDFWRFSPPVPEMRLPNYRTEMASAGEVETQVAKPSSAPSPLLLSEKNSIPLLVKQSLTLRNETQLESIELRQQEAGLAVLIPDSVAKIAPTRVFREGKDWKIHSEGSGEAVIAVNGIPLPSGISLPLAPNSELSVGGYRFKVEFIEK